MPVFFPFRSLVVQTINPLTGPAFAGLGLRDQAEHPGVADDVPRLNSSRRTDHIGVYFLDHLRWKIAK